MKLDRTRSAAIYIAMIGWSIFWSFPFKFTRPAVWPTDLAFTPLAHTFFAEGRPWGTETLHTSGIWGFLRFPLYNPDTFTLFVAANLALSMLIGWFFTERGLGLPRRRATFLLVSAALIPLLSASDDARWYMPLFGLLALRSERDSQAQRSPLVWGLAFGVALASHTKGNLFIATGVVLVALLASNLLQRRIPWDVIIIGAFSLVLLYVGGGDLAGYGRYTIHVLESTRAYPEAFSQSNSALAPAVFLLGVGLASLARLLQAEQRWQWPLALGFGVVLFLLYKGAFVRQDAIHITRSLTAVLVVVGTEAMAAICHWPPDEAPSRSMKGAAALSAISMLLFLTPLTDYQVRWVIGGEVWRQPKTVFGWLGISREGHQGRIDRQLARVRVHAPNLKAYGTVATIGTYQTPLMAYGMRSETLPVVAHYEVWSPRTATAMNEYLASDEAPEFLVRSATFASASNEVTVARYYRNTPRHAFNYTLLERLPEPLDVSSETIFEGTVGWDEPIEIPETHWSSLLVVDVVYHLNLAGRLVGLLHHPPHAQLILVKTDGTGANIRLNSMLAPDGVVAAAQIPDAEYGGHLQRRGVPGERTIQQGHWGGAADALHLARHPILTNVASNVRSIELHAETVGRDASSLFKPELQVRVRVLTFSERADPASQGP